MKTRKCEKTFIFKELLSHRRESTNGLSAFTSILTLTLTPDLREPVLPSLTHPRRDKRES